MSAVAVLSAEEIEAIVVRALAKAAPPAREPDSEVMTREQVAKFLNVNAHMIPKLVRKGLPMHLLGGTTMQRFRRSEVLAWIDRGRKEGAHG